MTHRGFYDAAPRKPQKAPKCKIMKGEGGAQSSANSSMVQRGRGQKQQKNGKKGWQSRADGNGRSESEKGEHRDKSDGANGRGERSKAE